MKPNLDIKNTAIAVAIAGVSMFPFDEIRRVVSVSMIVLAICMYTYAVIEERRGGGAGRKARSAEELDKIQQAFELAHIGTKNRDYEELDKARALLSKLALMETNKKVAVEFQKASLGVGRLRSSFIQEDDFTSSLPKKGSLLLQKRVDQRMSEIYTSRQISMDKILSAQDLVYSHFSKSDAD